MLDLHNLKVVSTVLKAGLWLLLVLPLMVQASSVRQLSLSEVLDTASLIFAGEVISSEPRWQESGKAIETHIKFRIDSIIKGQAQGAEIDLTFLGGTVGKVRQTVNAMRYPSVGEKGVYFVIDPNKNYVHPLVGWSQGHYKEVMVDGRAKMVTADDRPIMAMRPTSFLSKTSPVLRLSHGSADGLVFSDKLEDAITKADFLERVRSLVAKKNPE